MKFQKRTHPARDRLEQAGLTCPGLWSAFEQQRLIEAPPDGCYVTGEQGSNAVGAWCSRNQSSPVVQYLTGTRTDAEVSSAISNFTTLACWRMTQGIYRLDPAIYEHVVDTPLTGDLPVDVFERLPEWCVYVETPGVSVPTQDGDSVPMLGAFARLDQSPDGGRYLEITCNLEAAPGLLPVGLRLQGSVEQAIDAILAQWQQDGDASYIAGVRAYVEPVLNLLLYIATQSNDIAGKHGAPGNPEPKRTRRDGWRLFPADGSRIWDVGVRMGAALRSAYHAAEMGTGAHAGPRGHVRRAHWHGFRSGPRKRKDGSVIPAEARKFDLRWLPPIPVNLGDLEDLPATIRKAK